MNHNLISCKRVLRDVSSKVTFVNDDWQEDAIDDIGAALGMLNIPVNYQINKTLVTFKDSEAPHICNHKAYIAFIYNNIRLVTDNNVLGLHIVELDKYPYSYKDKVYSSPLKLTSTLKEAKVTCYYATMPLDSEGYPLIPDNEQLINALTWYLYHCLLLGNKIINFPYNAEQAFQKWEMFYTRASNAFVLSSAESLINLHDIWINPLVAVTKVNPFNSI